LRLAKKRWEVFQNLTGELMKRLIEKLSLVVIALWVGHGCVTSSGTTHLPIHKRPVIPFAVEQPHKAFIGCGDDYFCISPEHLQGLRRYTIEMDALVRKYEHATEVFND